MTIVEISANDPTMTATMRRRFFPCRLMSMILSIFAVMAWAQEAPTPPVAPNGGKGPPPPMPPPMRRQGKGPGAPGMPGGPGAGPGERGFPRSGSNMSPLQTEGFERLPDEEKKRVRAAMEKAWSMPALQQAKERYIKANEEFRSTLRQTLQEVDPEVVKILEKMKPQQQMDPRTMPKLPPPTDQQFAKIAVDRLGLEVLAFVRPELREKIRAIHAKVMQQPEVAEAVKKLLDAPIEKRVEALQALRDVYRKAMSKELPNSPRAQQQRPTSADATGTQSPPEAAPEVKK